MRVRKRHAWGAVLILLFVLPVLRPQGVPFLEQPVGSFFGWFAKIPALNPQLWGANAATDDDPGPRERALEIEISKMREMWSDRSMLVEDIHALDRVLEAVQEGGLDRLPRVVAARVLRVGDASSFRRSILIDQGAEDGVVPGLAVTSGPVLIGRVDVVRPRESLVKLITDRQSRLEVALRTDRSRRLVGYVRGEGRGGPDAELDVRFVRAPVEAGRILPGATVTTSNADRLVPPGLIIGLVTGVSDRDRDDMPIVTMRPALDLDRSVRVLVLVPQ